MFGLGPFEIGIVFMALVFLFGPKRIPKMARALGESIREFRNVKDEIVAGVEPEIKEIAAAKNEVKAVGERVKRAAR